MYRVRVKILPLQFLPHGSHARQPADPAPVEGRDLVRIVQVQQCHTDFARLAVGEFLSAEGGEGSTERDEAADQRPSCMQSHCSSLLASPCPKQRLVMLRCGIQKPGK